MGPAFAQGYGTARNRRYLSVEGSGGGSPEKICPSTGGRVRMFRMLFQFGFTIPPASHYSVEETA